MSLVVRPYDVARDEAWASDLLDAELGGRRQARRGELLDVLADGLGLVAEQDGRPVGLLTYRFEVAPDAVELSAFAVAGEEHGAGAGTRLIDALVAVVRSVGRIRIRVVTTNDNLDALRFYQRRGFRLVELRPGAVDASRRDLKPAIPVMGAHGIPLRDELELERRIRTVRPQR